MPPKSNLQDVQAAHMIHRIDPNNSEGEDEVLLILLLVLCILIALRMMSVPLQSGTGSHSEL